MKKRNYKNKKLSTGRKKSSKKQKMKLKEETKNSILGIVFFILAILFALSLFETAGVVGNFFFKIFNLLIGFGYYILPILLLVIGVAFIRKGEVGFARKKTITSSLIFISILGIANIASKGSESIFSGGFLGEIISWPFIKLFGIYAGILILGAILIISLLVLFNEQPNLIEIWEKFINLFKRKEKDYLEEYEEDEKEIEEEEIEEEEEEEYENNEKEEEEIKVKKYTSQAYNPPPLSLLEKDRGKPNVGDVKSNMNIIKRTLMNFGISVEMDEVTIGPTITRYALKPAQGVKLSRIIGLQNDLALALAAHPIRIEAPIPGKPLVGIEIPNKVKSTVGLATILNDPKFQNSPHPLMIALGRGLSGKAIFGNLAKMPHCLIAGTTGSGKSVTIHSIITSLLYKNGPEDLRFIMVDPKRVELPLYNRIPHLLTPVITDPKKTILSLKWAVQEMDRRYDIFEAEACRDISSYNQKTKASKEEAEKLPYIIIVVDELADIMQSYPRELESAIVRLAQMSRAVGIHLILSTQRPSVNVITGLIKANIPTRVALQVSSQVDSRTILDQGGAEKLLGAGDMLYASTEMSQPERLQSAFISEEEVKKIVKYLRKEYEDEIMETIELSGSIDNGKNLFGIDLNDSGGDDDLYEDARMIIIESKKASTSFLQRKLGIGYARAAKLMDMLEERRVVGPANGSKPRDVLEELPDKNEGLNEEEEY
ncbi:MAG: DNA translocase FtsK 4TM domain-containing protein [Patescibacteria group bacterium]|nr:DNA translocase FtsK 4TM domain-containing protein [Patescibacteria group bacterium]